MSTKDTKQKKNIHAGHRERLRENALKTGLYNLDDIHFLELLLTYTITRADTNPIAHALLSAFGSVEEIFNASIEALLTVDGVGMKTARFLQYMSVVAHMYNKSCAMEKPKLDTVGKLVNFIRKVLPPSNNEQMILVILNKNLTLKSYKVFNGVSHSFISLDVNEITDFLVKYKAHFCAIAHTHPKHNPMPSMEDLDMFTSFNTILSALSINLMENVILGEKSFFSLKSRLEYDYDDDDDDHLVNSKNY